MYTLKTKTSKTKGPVLETILNAAPRNFKLSSTFLHLNKWWLKEAPFFIFQFVFCCCCCLFSLYSGFYISKISSGGFYPITSSCLPLSHRPFLYPSPSGTFLLSVCELLGLITVAYLSLHWGCMYCNSGYPSHSNHPLLIAPLLPCKEMMTSPNLYRF